MVSYRPLLISCLVPTLVLAPGVAGAAHASGSAGTTGTAAVAPVLGPQVSSSQALTLRKKQLGPARRLVGPRVSLNRQASVTTALASKAPSAPAVPAASSPSVAPAVPPTVVTVPSVKPTAAPVVRPAGPSGLAMPKGDLPGWRQVMAEDFNRTSLPSGWGAYSGQPGGNPGGWWQPSHVKVGDSRLTLEGYRDGAKWVTGGVMAFGPSSLTYGKYEVRFRMDKGKGVKYALLLWPDSERWPIDGEIDFAEDGGGNRTRTAATLHYGADNSQVQRHLDADFSTWQTIGVEWTPGKLVYTLNGKPWSTVTGSMVPTTAMSLALQTEAGTCGDRWTPCPDSTTPARVDLEVDWAVAYARS